MCDTGYYITIRVIELLCVHSIIFISHSKTLFCFEIRRMYWEVKLMGQSTGLSKVGL